MFITDITFNSLVWSTLNKTMLIPSVYELGITLCVIYFEWESIINLNKTTIKSKWLLYAHIWTYCNVD